MIRIRDILIRHGPEYVRRHGRSMPFSHLRALRDIVACRTDAMGVHVERCDDCGERRLVPHSCRNRLCPSCHAAEIQDWIAARAGDILPVRYFHVTFPMPSEYRPLIRAHQKDLESAMLQAAAESMQILARDLLGGQLGIMAAVHTWGRSQVWHPHVHCLVPGLVVLPDRTVKRVDARYLLPLPAVSKIFRAVFLRKARAFLPGMPMPEPEGERAWVVHCRPCVEGPRNVICYLGRYARRGPLDERAIISADDRQVVFRHHDHRTGRTRTCTLSPANFIARYLQHAPPPGFRRVRYYGFLAPGARRTLRAAQLALLPGMAKMAAQIAELREPAFSRPPYRCARCGGLRFTCSSFRGPFQPPQRPP